MVEYWREERNKWDWEDSKSWKYCGCSVDEQIAASRRRWKEWGWTRSRLDGIFVSCWQVKETKTNPSSEVHREQAVESHRISENAEPVSLRQGGKQRFPWASIVVLNVWSFPGEFHCPYDSGPMLLCGLVQYNVIIYFRYNIMRSNMINQAECQEFSSETNWLWPEQLSLETWLLKCHLDIVSSSQKTGAGQDPLAEGSYGR